MVFSTISTESELNALGTIHIFLRECLEEEDDNAQNAELFKQLHSLLNSKPFPPNTKLITRERVK